MLTPAEYAKLREIINAWPHDGDRIAMHRVINRLTGTLSEENLAILNSTLTSCDFVGDSGCTEPRCKKCHGGDP